MEIPRDLLVCVVILRQTVAPVDLPEDLISCKGLLVGPWGFVFLYARYPCRIGRIDNTCVEEESAKHSTAFWCFGALYSTHIVAPRFQIPILHCGINYG